jgi:predicted nucleic-acid-binding Zn-ribbon protein
MPLDAEQQQKVSQWLNTKDVRGCPACGGTNLSMHEMISGVVVDAQGSQRMGGQHTPMVQVFCDNCMYTMLFAAGPIGLIQQ